MTSAIATPPRAAPAPTDAGRAAMPRGACPTLFEPMATGDGLLVRLPRPAAGLSPQTLVALCDLAVRTGNGTIEVTARGNLQLRGLADATLAPLRDGLEALGLLPTPGIAIETNVLAGMDPAISGDMPALIEGIEARLSGLDAPLAPKLSILVDGGGAMPLDGMTADIRLRAQGGGWHLAIAGTHRTARSLGGGDRAAILEAIEALLRALVAAGPSARTRDLPAGVLPVLEGASADPVPGAPEPLGIHRIGDEAVAGLALPFGPIDTSTLARLAGIAVRHGVRDIRPAPERMLLLTGLAPDAAARLIADAAALGLISASDDPRRAIRACVGAPRCGSARLDTLRVATALARRLTGEAPFDGTIHVSGCDKGCAHPTPATLVLVGRDAGCALVRRGRAADRAERIIPYPRLDDLVARGPLFESLS